MSIHDMANRWTHKHELWKKKRKIGSICFNPLITQQTSIMENQGPLQELWEKRFRSHPGNFEPLRGKLNMERNGDL